MGAYLNISKYLRQFAALPIDKPIYLIYNLLSLNNVWVDALLSGYEGENSDQFN